MACNCGNKNRATASGAAGTAQVGSGTYRVMVGGRKVYESSSKDAADTVANRFKDAKDMKVLAPGESE